MIFINVGPSCSHIVVVVHDVDINWLLMSHFFLLSVVSCMHNIKTQLLEYMTVGNVGYSTITTNNRPMGSNGMPNARWVKAFFDVWNLLSTRKLIRGEKKPSNDPLVSCHKSYVQFLCATMKVDVLMFSMRIASTQEILVQDYAWKWNDARAEENLSILPQCFMRSRLDWLRFTRSNLWQFLIN